MADRLLPPNATKLEEALEQVAARIGEVPIPVSDLWDPDRCPPELLPWLAWSWSVDEWDPAWPEATQRAVIGRAIELHRRKGTVWAVREGLRSAGYAQADIQEGLPRLTYDGSTYYEGVEGYGGGTRWALFRVIADLGEDKSLTAADIRRITRLVERYKPASRHLRELGYRATVVDEVEVADAIATVVGADYQEVRPAGRRYDGSLQHDQAVPLRYDASYRYAGGEQYDGRDELGETYGNEWDRAALSSAIDLGADSVAVAARYDGRLHYSGFRYGADAPSAVDPAMPIQVRRHIRYDGRHDHAGATYDGAWLYDGAHDFWGGIHYAGDQITEEAVL